jgi:hypothetical protein
MQGAQGAPQPVPGGMYRFEPGLGFVYAEGGQQASPPGDGAGAVPGGPAEAPAAAQGPAPESGAGRVDLDAAFGAGFAAGQASARQQAAQAAAQAAARDAAQNAAQSAAENAAKQGMYGQGKPEGAEPKFDQNRLGEMYGAVQDVMNGQADPGKLLGLFQGTGGEFWKGALVGAATAFLCTNETVRQTATELVGGLFGSKAGDGEEKE